MGSTTLIEGSVYTRAPSSYNAKLTKVSLDESAPPIRLESGNRLIS